MQTHVKRARVLAHLLDRQFEVFGIRIGLDPILSLVPFIGDTAGIVLSLYIVWVAWKVGVPFIHIVQMIFHLLVDVVVGTVPFIGDLFDIYYKANMRNIQILTKHTSGLKS